jgi:hypothetical protein
VSYQLVGKRAGCYVAPQNDACYGEIINAADSTTTIPSLLWGVILRQEVTKNGGTRYVPWSGVSVGYAVTTAAGEKQPQQKVTTYENGVYVVDNIRLGDTVRVIPLPMHSYKPGTLPMLVPITAITVNVGDVRYRQDSIAIEEVTITSGTGNTLVRWQREEIVATSDTIIYPVPCDVSQLTVSYTSGENIKSTVDGKDSNGSFQVDSFSMGKRGRSKAVSVKLSDLSTDSSRSYTFVLEKPFGLFDVVTEHIGSIRIVNNNPKFNRHGLTFKSCVWYLKREADTAFMIVETDRLYCTAGESVYDRFEKTDSMYLYLLTTDGDLVTTCSDGTYSRFAVSEAAQVSQLSWLTVYPNPVLPGGAVKLKRDFLVGVENDEHFFYAKVYLFDANGRLVLEDSASALYNGSGMAMPKTPGVYHLVLESADGKRKSVKIAVGGAQKL